MKYADVSRLTSLVERLDTYVYATTREVAKIDCDFERWEILKGHVANTKQDILDLFNEVGA